MKKTLNVALIGHVNHGKTTLAAAMSLLGLQKEKLSFEEINKFFEKKVNGLIINKINLLIESTKRLYDLVDCENHSDILKNIIVDDKIDAVILVISAVDELMTQAQEQIILARKAGIKNIIV